MAVLAFQATALAHVLNDERVDVRWLARKVAQDLLWPRRILVRDCLGLGTLSCLETTTLVVMTGRITISETG